MYETLTEANLPVEALYQDNPRLYFDGRKIRLWEADPWYETDRSWFESSYIHAGISGYLTTYSGPDAQKMISYYCINNVYKWKVGTCKHLVMLDEKGLVINHALFIRRDEDVFSTTAGSFMPLKTAVESGKYDVKQDVANVFILQLSGPRSLTILEKVTQQNLHDLKFLRYTPVNIPGIECDMCVVRIGMSGTLAYELHGPAEFSREAYDAVLQAGKEYGIKRLGWRDYTVNHTFGGFPQMTVHFEPSWPDSDELAKVSQRVVRRSGSVDPTDKRACLRSAVETDWAWMADMDHDFVGKDAVVEELANPKRKLVSLEWNTEDIIDVFASQFTDNPYKYMDMPCAQQQQCGGHQDYVMDAEGNVIGFSSCATFSSWFRKTVSLAVLDIDQAEEGKEVVVQWGDFGKKMKSIRAVVAPYPYIHGVELNQHYDVSKVPSGI